MPTEETIYEDLPQFAELGGAPQGGNNLIAPLKAWAELTTDERIERLHTVAQGQRDMIVHLFDQLNRLMSHTHGPHGELLGPLYGYGSASCGSVTAYDPLA